MAAAVRASAEGVYHRGNPVVGDLDRDAVRRDTGELQAASAASVSHHASEEASHLVAGPAEACR